MMIHYQAAQVWGDLMFSVRFRHRHHDGSGSFYCHRKVNESDKGILVAERAIYDM